jgi:hypothetical protein
LEFFSTKGLAELFDAKHLAQVLIAVVMTRLRGFKPIGAMSKPAGSPPGVINGV